MMGSTAFPFFIFGGTWLEKTAEFLPRIRGRGNTVIGNDVRGYVTMKGKPLTTTEALEIARLPAAAADDIRLTSVLAGLINDAYAVAEKGLWANGTSYYFIIYQKHLRG
jgi:hypothetical protein